MSEDPFFDKKLFDDPEAFKKFFSGNQEMLENFFGVMSGEFIQRVEFKEHPKGKSPGLGIWFYPKKDWEDVIGNK